MAYTTNQLISDAYYASGVVSREFETVSGSQISDGLQWLNNILLEKRVDDSMIPYETKYNFNAIEGQEIYFIPNLIKIDTIVFYLDQVRYSLQYTKRNAYLGSPRVENIKTLMYEWFFEREKRGGNLYMYFKPDKNYPIEIHGVFDLGKVSLGQDLLKTETIFNLGIPFFYSALVFLPTLPVHLLEVGQLVVNEFDLEGFYETTGSLANYINTGIIPGVRANIDNLGNFILYASDPDNPTFIDVKTSGYPPIGTRFIQNVRLASTTNVVANYQSETGSLFAPVFGQLFLDGIGTNAGDFVLLKNQTDNRQNGLYYVEDPGSAISIFVLRRPANWNDPSKMREGDIFTTLEGLTNEGFSYILISEVMNLFLAGSPIIFEEFIRFEFPNFLTLQQPDHDIALPMGFDDFFITYLKYALAERICAEYNYDTPTNVTIQMTKYASWIAKKSRILDMQLTKVSTLQKDDYINWGFVNLGKGWRPS